MKNDAYLFNSVRNPLTPSEMQWIYSHDGSSTPEDVTDPRVTKVRMLFTKLPSKLKILDVGCANGAILQSFRSKHELHGVDISECLIKAANKNGFIAKVHDLSNDQLPYEDGIFDVVFSGETIEHQIDTDWFLLELNRVLKPGGKLILTFPNIRTLLGIAMMLFDMPPMYSSRYRHPHFRDFTLRYIKLALARHGFSHEKSIGSTFYLPKIGQCCSSLATFFPSWSQTTIVVAKKIENSKYTPMDLITDNNFFTK